MNPIIDLLQELIRKKQPRKDKLRSVYLEVKEDITRRPTYLELHLQGKVNSQEYHQEFGSYIGFLYWAKELWLSKSSNIYFGIALFLFYILWDGMRGIKIICMIYGSS